jgi:hypothetical protein
MKRSAFLNYPLPGFKVFQASRTAPGVEGFGSSLMKAVFPTDYHTVGELVKALSRLKLGLGKKFSEVRQFAACEK